MPTLRSEVVTFLDRVKDGLRSSDVGSRASLTTTKSGSDLIIRAREPGVLGNGYTVEFTLPGGTSALTVSAVGQVVTVALDVTVGVATAGANTFDLIAAKVNSSIAGLHAYVAGSGSVELTAAVAVASLAGGAAPSSVFAAAPIGSGYLRAQDLAGAFELMQEATAASLTATGGTTTTAIVASIPSGAYVGATVEFAAATTTAALRGVTATVISHNATTFTFGSTLPAAVANTDTFTVTSTLLDGAISELRDAAGRAGSPVGEPYGRFLTFVDASQRVMEQWGGSSLARTTLSHASLAVAASPAATSTVVPLTDTGMKIGAFNGLLAIIGGQTARIDYNTEDTLYLAYPLPGGAPAAAAATSIVVSPYEAFPKQRGHLVHVGGHPNSASVAAILDEVQSAVEALVLPA